MNPTPRRLGAALLALAACVACADDPIAPSELAGRSYALVRAGDARVPYVSWASPGDTIQVLADTITFHAAPRATRVMVWRRVERGGAPTVQTDRAELEYRLTRGEVEVGWFQPCGPLALCAPNLIGPATAAELRLTPAEAVATPVSHYAVVARPR